MYDAEIDLYICPASRELYCIEQETNKKARKNYVGLNGENLIKTAWDGIWVSENGDYIYLWDSKNQKYLAIKNYIATVNGGTPAQILANGLLDCLPVNDREDGGYEIDNILLSLVYGYNRTESRTVK